MAIWIICVLQWICKYGKILTVDVDLQAKNQETFNIKKLLGHKAQLEKKFWESSVLPEHWQQS